MDNKDLACISRNLREAFVNFCNGKRAHAQMSLSHAIHGISKIEGRSRKMRLIRQHIEMTRDEIRCKLGADQYIKNVITLSCLDINAYLPEDYDLYSVT